MPQVTEAQIEQWYQNHFANFFANPEMQLQAHKAKVALNAMLFAPKEETSAESTEKTES